jgi:hypothetical protein
VRVTGPSARREYAVYALVATLSVLPALVHPGATVGDGVDAFGTYWFYWWTRFCVEHFGNPGTTNLFFYPFGKDIFAHTGNNLVDAVMSVPFQWVFGPWLYQPLFVATIVVGNAIAFRPLARYVLGGGFAAFAATLLFQTNPFVLFEITAGRPTQGMMWFVPVAILYFLKCAREPEIGNAVRFGVATALVGWTYWFNGYFLVLFLLPLAVWELRSVTDRRGALRRWALAALVCVVLVAPGIAMMVGAYSDGRVVGLESDPTAGLLQAPKPGGNNMSAELHGLLLMEIYGAPLFLQPAWGIPLLAALFVPKLGLPGGRARWFTALALIALLSIGPVATIGDHSLIMPLYMVLYRHAPFFNRLWFPYRMTAMAFVAAALVLGALVVRSGRPRATLAGLVLVGLLGQKVTGIWPFCTHDATTPKMLAELKDQGGAVIFVPFKIQHDGLMWQTVFQLPTLGGMGESASVFWPKGYRAHLNNSFVKQLRGAAMSPVVGAPALPGDREKIEKLGFRWVVMRLDLMKQEFVHQAELRNEPYDVDMSTATSIDAMTRVVGHPPAGLDGVSLLWDLKGAWDVTTRFPVTEEGIHAPRGEQPASPNFEVSLQLLGRLGTRATRPDTPGPR